jgi:2,3-bisphosphoglycerate-independent phosphoglycerate mutase
LRLAETEKYPHVTFFLNGGEELPTPGEDRVMVPSPKVATYDLAPEMSAEGVVAAALDSLAGHRHDLIVVNFANPDMVGHTGDLEAAIKAVETIDGCVGRMADAVLARHGTMILTADHGNCEVMWDEAGNSPHTAHTTNLVPVILVGAADGIRLRDGRLADLAPTLLDLMGLDRPAVMTGRPLHLPDDS